MFNCDRFALLICVSSVSLALLAGCSNSLMGSKGTLGNTGSGPGTGTGTGTGSGSGSGSGSGTGTGTGSGTGQPPPAQNPGNVLSNLQASGGWNSWGELAPAYAICAAPCPGVSWSLAQEIESPSMTGKAAQFNLAGTTPYSDVLWSNPLIGQSSTQNLPDSDHTLIPTLHNFTYDTYFYGPSLGLTQVLEFDINMYMSGVGMTWGTQCRIAGGNEWDVWDNVNAKWVPTGVACNPISDEWNHVTIQVQRESDNSLLYDSITLNGVTANINSTYPPSSVPGSWWGITVNYQMDGNYKQAANTTYLDNLSLTYQ